MLTIEQAVNIFRKSEYATKCQLQNKYLKYKDGYVLISKQDGITVPGAPNFLVTSDGKIHPISPVAIAYNNDDLKSF